MKAYIHDPNIYREHFHKQVGHALPGFKGARVQHGEGIGALLGLLARKAVPLLKTGFKIAAPHLKQATKSIAKEVGGKVSQAAAAKFAQVLGSSSNVGTRKKPRQSVRRRKKGKRTTSNDIF